MDAYCETGVHPDIEKAVQEHEDYPAEKPLPPFRHNRPFVYFEFSIAREPVGRITVELFEEHNPRGVEILQNRCRGGCQESLMKTRVHKLLTECAFFIARPRRTTEKVSRPHLNHTDRGAVSLSMDGNEVAITLAEDTLALDETHQVIGRVHMGMEVLKKINDVIPGPRDVPLDEILISRCGFTDHRGEPDVDSSGRRLTPLEPEDAVRQLRQEAERTQNELKSALEEGLNRKRKQDVAASERGKTRKRILDLSSSSSSDEESDH